MKSQGKITKNRLFLTFFLQRMRCKLIDILQTLVVKIICIIAWRGPHSTVRNIVIVVNLHLPFFPGIFS